MCTGISGRPAGPLSLSSGTLLTAPLAALGEDLLRLPRVLRRPRPALQCDGPRPGLGASQGPAGGCRPTGSIKAAGQREVSLLSPARLCEVPRISRKARSRRSSPLLFPAPVLQELGTAEPRLLLSGVTRTRCSARPAPLETLSPNPLYFISISLFFYLHLPPPLLAFRGLFSLVLVVLVASPLPLLSF